MKTILEIYHAMPWGTIGALLVASGLATTLTQLVKKKLSLVSKKVINTFLLATSFAPVAIQYLTEHATQNPGLLGGKALAVAGFASTVLYPHVISPLSKLLEDAKAYRADTSLVTKTEVNIIEPGQEFQG